jgi:hypothetical protein
MVAWGEWQVQWGAAISLDQHSPRRSKKINNKKLRYCSGGLLPNSGCDLGSEQHRLYGTLRQV